MNTQTQDQAAMFQRMVEDVVTNFKVTRIAAAGEVHWMEAEAKTGTRYEVVTAYQPGKNAVLVAVVCPWNSSEIIGNYGLLHENYVDEKLNTKHHPSPEDLAAVTLLIGKCLDRPVCVGGIEVQPT